MPAARWFTPLPLKTETRTCAMFTATVLIGDAEPALADGDTIAEALAVDDAFAECAGPAAVLGAGGFIAVCEMVALAVGADAFELPEGLVTKYATRARAITPTVPPAIISPRLPPL